MEKRGGASERPAALFDAAPVFAGISGPLDPNGTKLTPAQLEQLESRALGPPLKLHLTPPPGSAVSATLYNAYRATSQFISPMGQDTGYSTLAAGDPTTTAAMRVTPATRVALTKAATASGAIDSGVAGQAAAAYDISRASHQDLVHIFPIVLLVIGILLAVVLRSLVAPCICSPASAFRISPRLAWR